MSDRVISNFHQVDRARDPSAFVQYLGTVSAIEAVQAYKRQTYALLELRPGAEGHVVKSPMVGTFYRAPAPDADPYVEENSPITVGQTVCIVEAMKLMNEIESEVEGRIARILVENAQPVEYGQTLFLVESDTAA